MHIDFHDHTKSVPSEDIDLLQRLVTFAAQKEKVSPEAELSINFVDNKDIRELNRNYRQQDKPTDVISFALLESVSGEIDIIGEDIPLALGDIVVSIDKTTEQAEEYGHSIERELAFLTIHGFLHLLGYNHRNKMEETIMFNKQNEIL